MAQPSFPPRNMVATCMMCCAWAASAAAQRPASNPPHAAGAALTATGCPAPTDEFMAWPPSVFQYDPPPEARDVRVTVQFNAPTNYRKRLLIRQGQVPAVRLDSQDGSSQTAYFQSDGQNQVEFETEECGPAQGGGFVWSATYSLEDSTPTYGADTTFAGAEGRNGAVTGQIKFTLSYGPAIARPRQPVIVVPNNDVQNALEHIRWAWNDHGPCTRFLLCATYIDDVGIEFSNGDFGPHVGIYRLTKSAHDCIEEAKHALAEGKRGVAVEWVMASQIHNPPVRDWLRKHPDAVVAALPMVN